MISSNSTLSPFEREILEFFLAGDDLRLRALETQLALCTVASRTLTGAGFATDLLVAPSARYPGAPNIELTDVAADIEGLQRGAILVLFIRGGGLDALEGSTFGEPWPPVIKSFKLRYLHEPRTLVALKPLLPPHPDVESA